MTARLPIKKKERGNNEENHCSDDVHPDGVHLDGLFRIRQIQISDGKAAGRKRIA